jgi:multicomponent Na+:H+ antiporter subunit E
VSVAVVPLSVAVRWIGLILVWLALAGAAVPDIVVGTIAAGLGTVASLVLIPPGRRSVSVAGIVGIVARFPFQSLAAGIDVAGRAVARPVRIAPGIVPHPVPFAPGAMRSAFRAWSSLQPGTLPVRDAEGGDLHVHHLDTGDVSRTGFDLDAVRFARVMRERRS